MKLDECEEIILSAMAEIDGEMPLLSAEQTAQHLSRCEQCRMEIKRQEIAVNLLQKQKRRAGAANLWFEIEKRIDGKSISELFVRRYFFLLLGSILVVYKLVEMIPAQDFGLLFKFVPLIFIAVLFYFFNENPFKINTELKLEGRNI
jgi:hypothetical protein